MERGRLLKFGGLVAGIVLILFGIGSLWLSIDSRMTVQDELSAEKIVGSPDMSPEGIAPGVQEAGLEDVEIPDCDVAEEEIDTGEEARCFAQYMRIHALESSGDSRMQRWDASCPRTTRAIPQGRATKLRR